MSRRKRTVGLPDIFTSKWLIDKRYAQAFFPSILKMIKGEADDTVDPEEKKDEAAFSYSFATDTNSINVYPISEYAEAQKPEDAPANSVAIIDLKGAITKNDQWCGGAGTETKRSILQRCFANDNIVAIVFDIDSGGGEGNATENLAEEIKNAPKPVLAFVNGMACSAAYWLASACREVYMSGKISEVGSIGTYVEIADFTNYYKEMGVDIIRIYAPQSTLKNKAYEDALKGDDAAMKEDLSVFTDFFINEVKANRQKLRDDKKVFKGACYYTDEAIDLGLADAKGSMVDCIVRAYELADAGSTGINVIETVSTTPQAEPDDMTITKISKSKNMWGNKFPQLSALKGKEAKDITDSNLEKVNAELVLNGISNVTVVSSTEMEQIENKNTDLENKVEALTLANTALTEKVTKLEAEDGAGAATTEKKKDTEEETADDKIMNAHIAKARAAVGK